MTERRQVILGFCFIPSVFSSEEVLEAYYQSVAKPFLSIAFRFQDVHFAVFFSGPLLNWLRLRHSEYVAALSEMLKRKQVEVLSGGFFAPLLPLIPPGDRVGQIEELTTTVRKMFGKRPRGLWLTKTVWDPGLVSTIAASGLEFTFLDEKEFERLGIEGQRLHQPRLTEFQGRLLTVLPHHARLSAEVQHGSFDGFLRWSREAIGPGPSLLSIFHCFDSHEGTSFFSPGSAGFEAFLDLVRSENLSVESVTPSAVLRYYPQALERSYFTGTTYEDLAARLGRVAPPQSRLQSWKHFLADDKAANSLYNKMVYVNLLVSSLRGDKYKKKSAYEDLWKSQTSSAYLGSAQQLVLERKQAFACLLNAEVLLRDRATFTSALSSQDFDLDGVKEYLFQGKSYNYYVDSFGGQVFEWDCLDRPWNYVDETGGRGIHRQVFVDRFFRIDQPEIDAAQFYQREYKLAELSRDSKTLALVATDHLEGRGGLQPIRLRKTFIFDENTVQVDYELELLGGPDWEGWFTSEVHLTAAHGLQWLEPSNSVPVTQVVLADSFQKSRLQWSWTSAAQVSVEDGSVQPRWWMILHPGEPWRCRVNLLMMEEA